MKNKSGIFLKFPDPIQKRQNNIAVTPIIEEDKGVKKQQAMMKKMLHLWSLFMG
ncbi:MAG: hypothetical protein GY702_21730 [Desulfobulbaceae bacterium]|nr:hypothetical protein [Desulfobulbaceae bacterium]